MMTDMCCDHLDKLAQLVGRYAGSYVAKEYWLRTVHVVAMRKRRRRRRRRQDD